MKLHRRLMVTKSNQRCLFTGGSVSRQIVPQPSNWHDDANNTRIPETKDPKRAKGKQFCRYLQTELGWCIGVIMHDVWMHQMKRLGSVCFQPQQANRKMIMEPKQTDSKTDFSVFLKALTCWWIIYPTALLPADHRFPGVLLSALPQTVTKCLSDWLFKHQGVIIWWMIYFIIHFLKRRADKSY